MTRTRLYETPDSTFELRHQHRGNHGNVTLRQVSGVPLTAAQWQRVHDGLLADLFLAGANVTRVRGRYDDPTED